MIRDSSCMYTKKRGYIFSISIDDYMRVILIPLQWEYAVCIKRKYQIPNKGQYAIQPSYYKGNVYLHLQGKQVL